MFIITPQPQLSVVVLDVVVVAKHTTCVLEVGGGGGWRVQQNVETMGSGYAEWDEPFWCVQSVPIYRCLTYWVVTLFFFCNSVGNAFFSFFFINY